MERKDVLYFAAAEAAGLVMTAVGIFDRVNTQTPPYEAIQPNPAYTIVLNAEYRLRSTILLGTGIALSLAVPASIGIAVLSNSDLDSKSNL